MCNANCIVFGAKNLLKKEINGKKVIEVGSCDVNGSLRPIVESMRPAKYLGIDIKKGRGVDLVCRAENLVQKFGQESFDVVISTEVLEHVKNWQKVISNIKNICKAGGIILITTRSFGYDYHGYPNDFWRFELKDIKNVFADCQILALERDYIEPGVFVKVKKPNRFVEKNLSNYKLFSITTNKRIHQLTNKDFRSYYFRRLILKEKIKRLVIRINRFVFSKI